MCGIKFQSWERFLYYAQNNEEIVPGADWGKASWMFDVDYLEADEWEPLQKILPENAYKRLVMESCTVEVRSFRMQEENDQLIFYSAGEGLEDGGYLCMGYAIIVEGENMECAGNRFVPMPDRQNAEKAMYMIGTERDFWNEYPILQEDLPDEILQYLAMQAAILDNYYGADRNVEGGMGGFCVVIPNLDGAAKEAYRQVLGKYYIRESMYEYADAVNVDGTEWAEVLYLTNNDYGIVMIYRKGVEA